MGQILRNLNIQSLHSSSNLHTKEILQINPTVSNQRIDAGKVEVTIFDYDANSLTQHNFYNVKDAFSFKANGRITWINIDGIRKADIKNICEHYTIHDLLLEDILSVGQRPKMDEINNIFFCLLNMLYFDPVDNIVETEQISIILGHGFVISIQDDAVRDIFEPLRTKLNIPDSKIRQRGADYLLYSMLDLIVDNYYVVMEQLGTQIEQMEESIVEENHSNNNIVNSLNQLRKKLIILKRNISPVRDLIANIMRSESHLLDDTTTKYFKDIYDHIAQAFELCDNYSDLLVSIRELYISNVNLRLNQVMKLMTVVTCMLAPAMVIGGIFGMNFQVIPYTHQKYGFYLAVASMIVIPIGMLTLFKKYGWFKN